MRPSSTVYTAAKKIQIESVSLEKNSARTAELNQAARVQKELESMGDLIQQ